MSQMTIPKKSLARIGTQIMNSSNYSHKTYEINESRRSVNDIMISVRPVDSDNRDSCYIHGISTTYTAAEIIKIINDKSVSANHNYFYNFNIVLPG